MKKLLVFGGSFDPPHQGHLKLLASGIRSLRPWGIVVVPARRSPLKLPHAVPARHRLKMLRLALAEEIGRKVAIRLDLGELGSSGKSYSYQTLRRLRRRHPERELWFLAGSDCISTLRSWKNWRELVRGYRWLVGHRPGEPGPSQIAGLRLRTLPGSFPDLSSTQLRSALALPGPLQAGAIPAAVARYIKRHSLYGSGLKDWLGARLKAGRVRHTLEVARLAEELAQRHGLDPEGARLAGLLHDIGRSLKDRGLIRYAIRNRLKVPFLKEVCRNQPILLHSYVSEDLARRRFGVRDPSILSAIRNHTLGLGPMRSLDRLLYVADAGSRDRNFREAGVIRRAAFKDLRRAYRLAVRAKLSYVGRRKGWRHPMSPDGAGA